MNAELFWAKVNKTGECWLWTGAIQSGGYGELAGAGHRPLLAHRVSYELLVGEIPPGLQVDHLCRVRACVNPEHLEPVTCKENIRRGRNAHREKTHCPQGHPYEAANLISRVGTRRCRTCQNQHNRDYRARRKIE